MRCRQAFAYGDHPFTRGEPIVSGEMVVNVVHAWDGILVGFHHLIKLWIDFVLDWVYITNALTVQYTF